jgi:hypothetical protein
MVNHLHLDTFFLQDFDASRLDTQNNISEDHTINTTLPETLSALTSIHINFLKHFSRFCAPTIGKGSLQLFLANQRYKDKDHLK